MTTSEPQADPPSGADPPPHATTRYSTPSHTASSCYSHCYGHSLRLQPLLQPLCCQGASPRVHPAQAEQAAYTRARQQSTPHIVTSYARIIATTTTERDRNMPHITTPLLHPYYTLSMAVAARHTPHAPVTPRPSSAPSTIQSPNTQAAQHQPTPGLGREPARRWRVLHTARLHAR